MPRPYNSLSHLRLTPDKRNGQGIWGVAAPLFPAQTHPCVK